MTFNNNLYEYNKFVINTNYFINCSYNNINLSKNGSISNNFYLNHSLNVIVKNYENESLSNINLIIYEFNNSYLTNITFNGNLQINLTEFLVLNSNNLNKTPHKLIITKGDLSEEKEISLNTDIEETFMINISEPIIVPVISIPSSSSSSGSGGGGSSKTVIKQETKTTEEPKIVEKEVIKEENTRFLELKQESIQNIQDNSVKKDISLLYFIPIIFLFIILLKIFKRKVYK
ncbi:MAG: hypothetical protein PHF86_09955 [Candidatus Nanoarchaeia archaeon]|nr:hypothetical protein [Candidatus Nanoarchaeia archaeon]